MSERKSPDNAIFHDDTARGCPSVCPWAVEEINVKVKLTYKVRKRPGTRGGRVRWAPGICGTSPHPSLTPLPPGQLLLLSLLRCWRTAFLRKRKRLSVLFGAWCLGPRGLLDWRTTAHGVIAIRTWTHTFTKVVLHILQWVGNAGWATGLIPPPDLPSPASSSLSFFHSENT